MTPSPHKSPILFLAALLLFTWPLLGMLVGHPVGVGSWLGIMVCWAGAIALIFRIRT